ncbi:hypothetical protein BLOT_010316 [Blomia tropicalis]|nr:hypothetical protein BLOT_010316 [Blomia tropicalis]
MRLASNCRTMVHKPENGHIQIGKQQQQQGSLPFLSMRQSSFNNLTNKFISPQTINVKTSPNGEITVINGKAVTPILYEHERPLPLPTFERLSVAPTSIKSSIESTTNRNMVIEDNSDEEDEENDSQEEEEEEDNKVRIKSTV